MNEVDLLNSARRILAEPASWVKRRMENDDRTAFCALGALYQAARTGVDPEDYWAARDLLTLYLPGEFRELQHQEWCLDPIAQFNDDPETTHQDILNLFDKALADLGGLA